MQILRNFTTLTGITTAAAVGSGLAGGVFFAFSSFVMPALRRLPSGQGIAAMQSINKQAPTPVFMTLLLGTTALSAGLGIHALLHRDEEQAVWLAGGSLSYLASIVLTAAFHIPRNDTLAKLKPDTVESARYWTTYLSQWTAGNHARTLTCAASAILFTVAARRGG
ncbi:MAG: anthrone oxygenase family protein [Ilumatobacteraceae bacterium]